MTNAENHNKNLRLHAAICMYFMHDKRKWLIVTEEKFDVALPNTT